MEFKGTKGKWEVNKTFYEQGVDGYIPIKSNITNRGWIAEAKWEHVNEDMSIEEFEANALLISKAPEMLEMLKECKEALDRIGHGIIEAKIEQLIKEATELW
jgi:hypothetical protein